MYSDRDHLVLRAENLKILTISFREKLLPEETEPLHVEENASCHLDENEAELNDGQHFMLKLDEAILKDIESGPVSRCVFCCFIVALKETFPA